MMPAQYRAARALLNWTQPELAAASKLGLSTVVDFEKVRRSISDDATAAIRTPPETAGVEFIDGDGVELRL